MNVYKNIRNPITSVFDALYVNLVLLAYLNNFVENQTTLESKIKPVIVMDKNQDNKALSDLALNWLANSPFLVKTNCLLEGRSGEDYKIDFMIENDNASKLVIKVADQGRTIGTNVINKMEKISKDLGFKTLLITNKVSVQAKHLAKRTDIMIMERDELETVLKK